MSEPMPLYEQLRKDFEPPHYEDYGAHEQGVTSFNAALGRWVADGAYGFWLPPDARDGHCDAEKMIRAIAGRIHEMTNAYNGKAFGSPIEEMLFAAMLWLEVDWAGFPQHDFFSQFDESPSKAPVDGAGVWITPQARIAGHTVDFAVWAQCKAVRRGVAIECDGHDFHEKTKEQASRDKKRDREILAAGYPVLRFTGSEIYRNVLGCADQVGELLSSILHDVSKEGGLF